MPKESNICLTPSIWIRPDGDCEYCLEKNTYVFDCDLYREVELLGRDIVAYRYQYGKWFDQDPLPYSPRPKDTSNTTIVRFNQNGVIDSLELPFQVGSDMILSQGKYIFLLDECNNLYKINFNVKTIDIVYENLFPVNQNSINVQPEIIFNTPYRILGDHPTGNFNKITFSLNEKLYVYDYEKDRLELVDTLVEKYNEAASFSENGKWLVYIYENRIILYDVTLKTKRTIFRVTKEDRELIRAYFDYKKNDTITVNYSNKTNDKLFMKAWSIKIDRNGRIIEGEVK